MNHEILNVKSMLTWAVQAGLIHQNPIESLKSLPVAKHHIKRRRRALTEEEIGRFLAAAAEDDREQADHVAAIKCIEAGARNAEWRARERTPRIPQLPFWRGFLETGARYGELSRTAWGDFSRERRSITLRGENTKNGKSRVIPITDEFAAVLVGLHRFQTKALGRKVGRGDRIFLTPEGCNMQPISKAALCVFWRILELAEIPRVDAQGDHMDIHGLRHSFASRLARAGVGLLHAQRLLGHSDPKLTAMIYTHFECEDLRAAIDKVPPMGGAAVIRDTRAGARTA
ncbi:MAG: site-specific integrase [Planctomycetes bacterium]|nr:site-specific integrase [Planctomycetota bacterium]